MVGRLLTVALVILLLGLVWLAWCAFWASVFFLTDLLNDWLGSSWVNGALALVIVASVALALYRWGARRRPILLIKHFGWVAGGVVLLVGGAIVVGLLCRASDWLSWMTAKYGGLLAAIGLAVYVGISVWEYFQRKLGERRARRAYPKQVI
jgi:drug/metabolite transporter (DMT)-like permease